MYCTSYSKTYSQGTGSTYTATAEGSTNTTGFHSCSYNGKKTPSYTFSAGTKKYMTNYIYETSCIYGNIYCSTRYTTYAKFEGKWSPDSV